MKSLRFFALSTLLLLLLGLPRSSAIEAKWTPAEGEGGEGEGGEGGGGGGPLPLSQNQRNQLVQLDQAISQSPDPEATLVQVAEQNRMKPEELADLLMRNRRDMQMAGEGGGGGGMGGLGRTLPRRILGAFGGLLVGMAKTAKTHPRQFTLAAAAVWMILYVVLTAPRTGVIISSGPSPILSSGYTTLLTPPAAFIHSYLESSSFLRLDSSLPEGVKPGKISKKLGERIAKEEKRGKAKDGVTVEELGRKSDLAFSITARKTVDVESLLPDYEEEDNMTEELAEARWEIMNDAIDAAHIAAVSVLSSRRFTEFVEGPKYVRFYSGDKSHGSKKQQQGAVLVAKSMGDFGRFGMQPLRVAFEEEGADSESIAFGTLDGGHFDGEIRFSIERRGGVAKADTDEEEAGSEMMEEGKVIVSVSLCVPKSGRVPNRRLAKSIVSSLVESIQSSVVTQAKQTLARRSLSNRYRGRASGRATEKRHINYLTEKKLEEMAEDRRRRWQRGNPDAGRYRPSGKRMISPNNC